jgi:pantoate--beta-alanine ligase
VEILEKKADVRRVVAEKRNAGLRIGLVPTMGYFHEGHLSLMRVCRGLSDFTVVSLFVNPIQFGPNEDLARYPRDIKRDMELAASESVDLLFVPEPGEMYFPDSSTYVLETAVSQGLCGRSRPGHFRGVATVVTKLFNIVTPEVAVFGRKDLQQLTVIRRLVRDLDLTVRIEAAPTVREPDGLAMSSRNVFLNPGERSRAPEFYRGLLRCAQSLAGGEEVAGALEEGRARIESRTGGRIDYLSAVDESMSEAGRPEECRYLAAALWLGKTRLIDNVDVRPGAQG